MVIYALIGVAVAVGLFLIVVALRPSKFRVVRSITIVAPAPAVFAQVNDLRKWPAWSPWAKRDPTMRQTYEGPSAGVGAIARWDGNKQVGAGSTTITESRPSERIRITLEMLRPFAATNDVEFAFKPEGEKTAVTWSMDGTNNFLVKAVGLFMNMDKMIGGDFEQGLAQMKSVAEAECKR